MRIDDASGEVTFQLPHGPMIGLLRESGFTVEDLLGSARARLAGA